MGKKMILSNQVKCKNCKDEPYSAHVHDFKYCKCGSIAVDGGMFYLRRVGDLNSYEDLSIEMDDKEAKFLLEKIQHALDTGRNALGILCAVERGRRDFANGKTIKKQVE